MAIAAGSGKVKSLPHVPGRLFSPNSAPDSLTPSHSQPVGLALGALEVVVAAAVVVVAKDSC